MLLFGEFAPISARRGQVLQQVRWNETRVPHRNRIGRRPVKRCFRLLERADLRLPRGR